MALYLQFITITIQKIYIHKIELLNFGLVTQSFKCISYEQTGERGAETSTWDSLYNKAVEHATV